MSEASQWRPTNTEHLRSWASDIGAWSVRGLAETEYQIGHVSGANLVAILMSAADEIDRLRAALPDPPPAERG